MKTRIDIDHNFEFPDDKDWGRKFWKGFTIAILLAAVLALGFIRLAAFALEKYYE